jgi:hypothetical protein
MFSRSNGRSTQVPLDHEDDWVEVQRPPRDWKKVFLVVGLGTLSWVATYVGMLELIQANMGQLDFVTKIVIGFSVAMLMTMIIWLLDQMFAPHPFGIKLAYVVGYLFLTLISVGFGFGFYWKVLESRTEASRSAESAVGQVQAALVAGAARLDQLQGTLDQLTRISQEKAVIERESGASCPNSRPGDGPRRRLRDADAQRFSFASEFVKGRSAKVKAEMKGLDGDLKRIVNRDPTTVDKVSGTRNKFLQALSRKLELTATNFNAFRTDPQLRQIRSELAARANRSTFPTGRGDATFSCPDPQLQSALFGVVKAIDQLPEMSKPEIATVEGAQAVVEAFRRLSATLQGALVLKLPPSADEIRELQKQAVRSVDPGRAQVRSTNGSGLAQGGLSQRDYIPLAIAVFVDLCLLLVSIGRPMNRLGGLVPKMRDAERGPVYQILSKFDDIHRDPKIREKFEVFRHVVFDFNGDYYVAVPLDSPRNRNPEEVKNLQLEAHLLANLFASFEKEKIFSRVYNPLLSRKTIQKKLWRQGSKFAASQAFRVYRFRNGAWSDIILGAVMGAARRAKIERVRRQQEAGPQLDVPETAAASGGAEDAPEITEQAAAARASKIIAETVGTPEEGAAAAADGMNDDWEERQAQRVAAQFNPYADEEIDPEMPESLRPKHQKRRSWPYQKPPRPPGEAHVELLPANSNILPEGAETLGDADADDEVLAAGNAEADRPGSDNVIVMPVVQPGAERHGGTSDNGAPRGTADGFVANPITNPTGNTAGNPTGLGGRAAATRDAGYTDILAHAIAMTGPRDEEVTREENEPAWAEVKHDMTSDGKPVPPPLPETVVSASVVPPSAELAEERASEPANGEDVVGARMNVRITQRTADFEIPLTAMSHGQPIDFLKSGAKITFSEPEINVLDLDGQQGHGQLRLDFDERAEAAVLDVVVDDTDDLIRDAADVADRPIVRRMADTVVQLEDLDRDDDVVVAEFPSFGLRADLPSEDDLVEISRRFAPARQAE